MVSSSGSRLSNSTPSVAHPGQTRSLLIKAFSMHSWQYVRPQQGVFTGSTNSLLSMGHSKPRSCNSLLPVAFTASFLAAEACALAWYCAHDALSGIAATALPSASTHLLDGCRDSSVKPSFSISAGFSICCRNERGMPTVRTTRGFPSNLGSLLVGQLRM